MPIEVKSSQTARTVADRFLGEMYHAQMLFPGTDPDNEEELAHHLVLELLAQTLDEFAARQATS